MDKRIRPGLDVSSYTDRLTEGLQANKMHKYVHISIYCSFILQNNG